MTRRVPRLLPVLVLSLVLVWVGCACAASPARGARAAAAARARVALVQSEEEQARAVEALTARVESLERQAQAAVHTEERVSHRAIAAISVLASVAIAVGAILLVFGSRGIRDIRRMARRIHDTRDQTVEEVRCLPDVDITREIPPDVAATLADLGKRLDLLETFGQPLEASDCIARGNAWYAQGDYERAASWYSRAIIADPASADAYYRKGIALQRLGKLEEALVALERVTQLDASDPEPRYVSGLVLQQLGRPEEAIAAYSKAIALSPQWARPYLNRAAAYARLGQAEQSLSDLAQAIELDPESRDAALANADFAGLRGNREYQRLAAGAVGAAEPAQSTLGAAGDMT